MELLQQAVTIMLLGMTLVFAFLAVVIGAVNFAARIIHRVEGAPIEEAPAGTPAAAPSKRHLAAAIAAAIHRFHHAPPEA